jgi:hypothetical protein
MLHRVVWYILTDVSEELIASSETSVNTYQTTWCNIPEDSHLHTRGRENLKSHLEETLVDQRQNNLPEVNRD